MTRPKLVSDDEVLDAARRVMLRAGQEPFTLSDVALEVGLSRAALIQRFENRAGLQLRVAERGLVQLAEFLAAMPEGKGVRQTWIFLRDLIASMGSSDRLPAQLMMARDDVVEPALNAIARNRNRLVRAAIATRLPDDGPMPAAEMASLLQAVLQGSFLQWGIDRDGEQKAHMTAQIRRALAALYPGETLPE